MLNTKRIYGFGAGANALVAGLTHNFGGATLEKSENENNGMSNHVGRHRGERSNRDAGA